MRHAVAALAVLVLLGLDGLAVAQEGIATTNEVPDRATLRANDGRFEGFQDRGRTSFRGTARDTAGERVGSVVPNRSGGGAVRSTDGRQQGFAPSRAVTPRFTPRSFRR